MPAESLLTYAKKAITLTGTAPAAKEIYFPKLRKTYNNLGGE
jgi:hypothetical protein